jgi:signal transduction histidine kinase
MVDMSTRKPPGRGLLTAYAGWQLLLSIPGLVLFVLSTVFSVLVVVWVGILLLLLTIPATRWIADQHRTMAARVLGHPVPAHYRPTPRGGPMAKLKVWAADPMTWRDHVWLLVAFVASFTLSLLVLLLFVSVVTWAIWWWGALPIMKARAAIDRFFLTQGRTELLEERVQVLTESRASSVDHSAAELRRIERDLHDGAQARLVALGMNLGMAEDLFASDPEGARKLVQEARVTMGAALGDLRSVVRGIHPPVLADRGLEAALASLADQSALPVTVDAQVGPRLPGAVETAAYFVVAEALANAAKHSGASRIAVDVARRGDTLDVRVEDDGRGGADPSGSGLTGMRRRVEALDGTLAVTSPEGGPTIVRAELPCAS